MTSDRPAKGIRRTKSGWQVYVRVKGEFRSKHFPPNTDLLDLKTHRDKMKARGWLHLPEPTGPPGSFARDVDDYLTLVAGMITYTDRAYRMRQWVTALGTTIARSDITSLVIRQQLERWRVQGRSPGTLNLYRTALQHFYSVMDGKSGRNPVKDVPRFREVVKPLHLPTLQHAEKAIRQLRKDSKSRARLRVLLWTGWAPAQLMRLTAKDIDRHKRRAFLAGRIKGKGGPSGWKPLLPQAMTALQELHRLNAYGKFSTQAMRMRLHRACVRAKVPIFNIYSLRHRYLTMVALVTKDERAVASLAGHADLSTTARYTRQSHDQRMADAIRAVQKSIRRT